MSTTHAVFDEASLERQVKEANKEATRQKLIDSFVRLNEQRRWAQENKIDDIEHQSGNRMFINIVEEKIKRLVPNAIFRVQFLTDNEARICGQAPGSSLRSLDIVHQDGTREAIIGFQNQAILPEFMVELTRTKRVPNPYINNLSMKDVPDTVLLSDGTEDEPKYKWEKCLPWETEVTEPCGLLVGWRTLLARLVHKGLTTPVAVEAEFGSADRASWANLMGKSSHNVQI